jgi:hypothetical protein
MKYICLVGLLAFSTILFGQDNDKNSRILLFVGGTVNASVSTNANIGTNIQGLKPAFSPGFELGFRYKGAVIKDWRWLNVNLGLGVSFATIRNRFVADNFVEISGYEAAQHRMSFLEGGIGIQPSILKRRVQIFGGYRLIQVRSVIIEFEYANISQVPGLEYTYSAEITVNPESNFYHAFVVRPEVTIDLKRKCKELILGIQGLVGNGGFGSNFAEGSYRFDSPDITAWGELYGSIASIAIIAQYSL